MKGVWKMMNEKRGVIGGMNMGKREERMNRVLGRGKRIRVSGRVGMGWGWGERGL